VNRSVIPSTRAADPRSVGDASAMPWRVPETTAATRAAETTWVT
jgi:hypothetical protein